MDVRHGLSLAIAASVLLSGCSREPKQPAAQEAAPPPALAPSTFSIPVLYSLKTISASVQQEVPELLQQKQIDRGPVKVHYTIRRGPIGLAGAGGDEVKITVPVNLDAEAQVPEGKGGTAGKILGMVRRYTGEKLGCQSTVEIAFLTKLSFGADWRIQSKTQPLEHHWVEPCKLSALQIDMTEVIDQPLTEELAKVAATIDEKIEASGDLKPKIEDAWHSLAAPVPVGSGRWLVFNPVSLSLGSIDAQGDQIHTRVGLIAKPEIVAEKVAPPPTALPANKGETPPDGFQVALPAAISFEEATRQLNAALAGQEISAPAGRKIRVGHGKVYGKGRRFAIDLQLTGDVNADVTLTGIPEYDPQTSDLYVDKLDYSLETQNLLAKAAAWIFDDQIRAAIAQKAHLSIKEPLEAAKTQLARQLNRKIDSKASLSGKVNRLDLDTIYVTEDAFVPVIRASGTLSLRID